MTDRRGPTTAAGLVAMVLSLAVLLVGAGIAGATTPTAAPGATGSPAPNEVAQEAPPEQPTTTETTDADGPDDDAEDDEGPTARTWGFVILILATALFGLDRLARGWANRRLAKEHERAQQDRT